MMKAMMAGDLFTLMFPAPSERPPNFLMMAATPCAVAKASGCHLFAAGQLEWAEFWPAAKVTAVCNQQAILMTGMTLFGGGGPGTEGTWMSHNVPRIDSQVDSQIAVDG